MNREGIIILCHGSRKEKTKKTTDFLTQKVQTYFPEAEVGAAYLQLAGPSLEREVERMIDKGIKKFTIVPLFIFNGVHVTEDIPEQVNTIKRVHPDVELLLTGHIGADDKLAAIIVDRIIQRNTVPETDKTSHGLK